MSGSRRIEDLTPFMAALAEALIERCAMAGIRIQITSTLRTAEEQAALYTQGRKPLPTVNALRKAAGLMTITTAENKRKITNAHTSVHQFGLAFDVVVVDATGRAVWTPAAYEPVGRMGEECGLEWGGRWERFPDRPHFQLTSGLSVGQLAAGLRPDFAKPAPEPEHKPEPARPVSLGDMGVSMGIMAHKFRAVVNAFAKLAKITTTNPDTGGITMTTDRKPGFKTSEFWLSFLAAVLPILDGALGLGLPIEGIVSTAGVVLGYVFSRTKVKQAEGVRA